jgi:prephenate dehydrogenase
MTGHVAVVGLGLIGGSAAQTLVAQGWRVTGWDPDAPTRGLAREAGVEVVPTLEGLASAGASIVVLAVPLRAVRSTVERLAPVLPESAVLTDVASVKEPVRDAVRAVGLDRRYVGAHPMAGTEHSGFAASDPELLRGARWALTVDPTTDLGAFLAVAGMVTSAFDGVVHPLADAVHDEAVALVSHVPHVVATELLNLVVGSPVSEVAQGLAAGSFRDGTRVARTTPRRTQAMVTDNAAWVSAALRLAARDLVALADTLDANGSADVFFDRADVLRAGGAAGETRQTVEVVLDHGRWQHGLAERGRQGARLVAVDAARRAVVLSEALPTTQDRAGRVLDA